MGLDELDLLRPENLIGVVEVDGADGADGGDEEEEEEESGDDWAHFAVASALMFLSGFFIQGRFFLAIWVWKIHPLHLTFLAFSFSM